MTITAAAAVEATAHLQSKRFTFTFERDNGSSREHNWVPIEPRLHMDKLDRNVSFDRLPVVLQRVYRAGMPSSERGSSLLDDATRSAHKPELSVDIRATINGIDYSGLLYVHDNSNPHNPGVYVDTQRVYRNGSVMAGGASDAARVHLTNVGQALWTLVTPDDIRAAWTRHLDNWNVRIVEEATKWQRLADAAAAVVADNAAAN